MQGRHTRPEIPLKRDSDKVAWYHRNKKWLLPLAGGIVALYIIGLCLPDPEDEVSSVSDKQCQVLEENMLVMGIAGMKAPEILETAIELHGSHVVRECMSRR